MPSFLYIVFNTQKFGDMVAVFNINIIMYLLMILSAVLEIEVL